MQETWIWSLGWEDPLEKEMATHSNIFAWEIPWTGELARLQSMWLQATKPPPPSILKDLSVSEILDPFRPFLVIEINLDT